MVTMAATALIVAAGFTVPLPRRVAAPAILQPRDAAYVYVEVPGNLDEVYVRYGEHVHAGEPITRLTNYEIQLELERLKGERNRLEEHLTSLRRRQGFDTDAANQIPQIAQALADLNDRISVQEHDLRSLTLVSPIDGDIIPARNKTSGDERESDLPNWTGQALDDITRGALLASGELVCLVGDSNQLEAIAVIDQDDVDFVQHGQQVKLILDEHPSTVIDGIVERVSGIEQFKIPPELSHKTGGALATVTSEDGERTEEPVYQARIHLMANSGQPITGCRGLCQINAGASTAAQRLSRAIANWIRFP